MWTSHTSGGMRHDFNATVRPFTPNITTASYLLKLCNKNNVEDLCCFKGLPFHEGEWRGS